jgi:hypothetical protein
MYWQLAIMLSIENLSAHMQIEVTKSQEKRIGI